MTDIDIQEIADNPSTLIDTGSTGVKSGGGKVAPDAQEAPKTEARKPESARDSLEAEFKKISEKPEPEDDDNEADLEAKAEAPKAKEVVKEPKPEKAEGEAAPVAQKQTPSEGKKTIAPPARFLPQAREVWANVPNPVKEEFERFTKETEAEISKYREAHTFREELKEYDEMARSHGTTVKQSLDNYVAIERKFAEDPAQGFRQLMTNLGMQPPQAISHILRAYGVTPQQLATHMSQNPTAYTALEQPRQQMPQPQAQPQQDPRVQQLEQRLQAMEAERVASSVIAPFAEEYPEYYQYETQIAEVLKSGIIDRIHGTGLSPLGKLEAALAMVAPGTVRNTRSKVQEADTLNETAAVDLRADKSIKSSPGTVTNVSEPAKKLPVRDMLEEELRKLQRRA